MLFFVLKQARKWEGKKYVKKYTKQAICERVDPKVWII